MRNKNLIRKNLIKCFAVILMISIIIVSFISNYKTFANNVTDTSIENLNTSEKNTNITSENYQEALSEYIKNNEDRIDENNPTNILDEFMEKNNLEYITKHSN